MTNAAILEPGGWAGACLAAALFAVDPVGTGGVALRALPGPLRDRWLTQVRALLPSSAPVRRIPLHVSDGRLLGGLDLAATLQAGRPVAERGILVEAGGGVVLLAMAERLSPAAAARITAVMDSGEVVLERDGLALRTAARTGVIALDEGIAEDERPPAALLERLALHLDLAGIALADAQAHMHGAEEVSAARTALPGVSVSDDILEALCATAMALGIGSARVALLALRVARAAAALAGRVEVSQADAVLAARLVLAPRATQLPAAQEPEEEDADEAASLEADAAPSGEREQTQNASARTDEPLGDVVLEAAKAAIPAGLLSQLQLAAAGRTRTRAQGKAGVPQYAALRGRPAGTLRGELRSAARLNVIETLRAAAPWQRLRRRDRGSRAARIEVRREDFRVARFKQRTQTTTIFVVDASGSAALHRLAEAKGAVELLLADCYVRRDRVALLAFRGRGAQLLLPPTRSLARAKRGLAGLPGGGATPLAAGIDAAAALADAVRRKGDTPIVILLTDGRANVARDGTGGRPRAEDEALSAARAARAAGFSALLVDTSPQPQPLASRLAAEMGATYLPLPHADAGTLSRTVRAATAA
jgi:magnesium chelatase subunit D